MLIVKQAVLLMYITLKFRSWNQPVLRNKIQVFIKETTGVFICVSKFCLTIIHWLRARHALISPLCGFLKTFPTLCDCT